MTILAEWATVSENVTDQVDGVTSDFVAGTRFRPGTARVTINGIPQVPGDNFIELDDLTVQLTVGFTLRSPDQIVLGYVPQ